MADPFGGYVFDNTTGNALGTVGNTDNILGDSTLGSSWTPQAGVDGSVLGAQTTGGTTTTTPANADYWNTQGQLVDNQLSRLPNQAQIGQNNILDAYNSAYQTLANQQGQEGRDYGTNRDQTVQDNVQAKAGIDNDVRSQLTGAQRLLGAGGAGNSSLSTIFAPYAAGRVGDTERGQVQTEFGRNVSALDTAHNDATTGFTNAFGSLLNDKNNKVNALNSSIDTTKAGLLGQKNLIAARTGAAIDPAVTQQIEDLGGQVDALGATPSFTPASVNTAAPNLSSYDYTKFNAPSVGAPVDPTLASNVGPFWTLLTGQDKQKANPVGVS